MYFLDEIFLFFQSYSKLICAIIKMQYLPSLAIATSLRTVWIIAAHIFAFQNTPKFSAIPILSSPSLVKWLFLWHSLFSPKNKKKLAMLRETRRTSIRFRNVVSSRGFDATDTSADRSVSVAMATHALCMSVFALRLRADQMTSHKSYNEPGPQPIAPSVRPSVL